MIAILMGASLASCTKEDTLENDDFSNEKKLVRMATEGNNGENLEVFTFKYDEKGRVIESTGLFDYGAYSWTNQYSWGDNTITCDGVEAPLKDGLIQTPMFAYNSSNRIIKYYDSTIVWDGDKIISMSSYIGSNMTFTYGESCKKGYSPLLPYLMHEYQELFYAHPEMIGARTRQLPIKIGNIPISYEFDTEGYITKIYINNSKPMTLTWE